MNQAMSFDWATIVEQLLAAGVKPSSINGGQITHRIIHHYRRGVQPLHWRGEMMLAAWCGHFGKAKEDAPQCPVVRGHRVDRRLEPGPKLQALPNWPPPAQEFYGEQRKKPGRKPKTKIAETV